MNLEDSESEDLDRYMDVTRGELFFSKGLIPFVVLTDYDPTDEA